jgi:hypothetical protein
MENFTSSQEIITGTALDLNTKFLFPFGCPVTFVKPTGRDHHFDSSSEYGIAVGSSKGSNGATLVLIPGRGNKPFARADVKRINHIPPAPAIDPTLLPTLNAPTDDPDIAEVIFHSSNISLDDNDEMKSATPKGTIGFAMSQRCRLVKLPRRHYPSHPHLKAIYIYSRESRAPSPSWLCPSAPHSTH